MGAAGLRRATRSREGQLLGTVTSIDGATVQEEIHAPVDGVVLFLTSSPAVSDGGLLLGLGSA